MRIDLSTLSAPCSWPTLSRPCIYTADIKLYVQYYLIVVYISLMKIHIRSTLQGLMSTNRRTVRNIVVICTSHVQRPASIKCITCVMLMKATYLIWDILIQLQGSNHDREAVCVMCRHEVLLYTTGILLFLCSVSVIQQ